MRRLLPLLGLLMLLAAMALQSPHNGPAEAAGLDRQRPALLDCTGKDGVTAEKMRQAQKAWAHYLGCKVEETVEISKGVTMTFVLVPPGKFLMGSPETEAGRDKDESLHTVTLTEPFYLGKYEVTQTQYQALSGKNQSSFKGPNLPVEMVCWEEANDYAKKLTKKRTDGSTYRLPTEAEWEYACRAGRPSSQPFGIGDGASLSSREANFNGKQPFGGAAEAPSQKKTCPIGSFAANALGLFDMHGNICEMCGDWYGRYPEYEVTNPKGRSRFFQHPCRGGCWRNSAQSCRSAARDMVDPQLQSSNIGFRLARGIPAARK